MAMKNEIHDLAAYRFSRDELFLLDANLWIYLYPPPSESKHRISEQYSAGLKSMQLAGSKLIMDVVVLSEYLNTYCRIEWIARRTENKYRTFKKFRNSKTFKRDVGPSATFFIKNILNICTRQNHPFAAMNIQQLLTNFEVGKNDINDSLLTETCRRNGWKLVTHDSDFKSGGINVLTTNKRLLRV